MSYILDALKKAERERGIAQVPTLATVHDVRATGRFRVWIVSGLCLMVAAVVLWLFFVSGRDDKPLATAPIQEPKQFENRPESAPIQPPIASAVSPSAVLAETPRSRMSDAAAKISVINRQMALSSANIEELEERDSVPPPEEMESPPRPPLRTGRAADVAAGAMASEPLSLREALAKMTMTIHLYSDSKAERRVFINGKRYIEGDYVDDKFLLESITPEGAVLSYQNERLVLRPGTK